MSPRQHEGSDFVRHVSCGTCGSSDGNALFSDGHTFCFACSTHKPSSQVENQPSPKPKGDRLANFVEGEVRGLRARKITDETCKHFGYAVGDYKGTPVQVAPYYDAEGNLVAQKLRFPNKDFIVVGDIKEALPFGAHAFQRGGKKVVVTEGEIDAMSMSQVQKNSWPVVSISCGADNPEDANGDPLPNPGTKIRRYFAKHAEYFRAFDEVVLMFDNDKQGQFSAKVAAEVLGSRARIASLPKPYKDPNEMLVADKTKELLGAMWEAQPYRPEGIVDIRTLEEKVKERPAMGISWWSPTLTRLTYGKRLGEIYTLGAGTGVGKTDFVTQDMAHMIEVHDEKIGVFALEQMVAETATRIAGKIARKTFHIPDSGWSDADMATAWAKIPQGKVFLYDSFGTNEWATVKDKMEFLSHSEGVRWFYLDHLTAFAAADPSRERELLEEVMGDMGSLVKRLGITIHLISHLATPEGTPHEEGGRVTVRQFKGARAIGFWSHFMFGMERDQQADDPAERSLTTFRVLKDRYTGRATGETIALGYDREAGILYESGEHKAPPGFVENEGNDKGPSKGGPSDF